MPVKDQPYPVPENWCWLFCWSVTDLFNGDRGTNYPSKKDYVQHGIPFINAGTIRDGAVDYSLANYITDNKFQSLSAGKIQKNDILYCLRGSLGKTAIIRDEVVGAISSSLCILRTRPNINREYFFWLLQSDCIQMQQHNVDNGTAQPNLSAASVLHYSVPLPPLSEQQRIVARIESLFVKLDEAREKAQEALESFGTRKKSIMHSAFTGELTCQWRKLHGISDEWRVLTLNDVAEYKKGPFGSSITKAMFVPKGENTYKVYEQGNAIRKTLNYGHYYITESKYAELKGFAVNPGDIIISCAGTIGEIYKLPENCEAGVINQALMRVRLYPCITDNYFIYYFSANIRADVEDKANGTAIKNIPPFKVMKAMDIMLPSVQEQNEIVRILDDFFAKEAEAKEKADATLETIGTMKKSILAKAFRGELGTNNPEDKSAEELLKYTLT